MSHGHLCKQAFGPFFGRKSSQMEPLVHLLACREDVVFQLVCEVCPTAVVLYAVGATAVPPERRCTHGCQLPIGCCVTIGLSNEDCSIESAAAAATCLKIALADYQNKAVEGRHAFCSQRAGHD